MRQFLICFTIIATLFCFSTALSEDQKFEFQGSPGGIQALLVLIPQKQVDLYNKPEIPLPTALSEVECGEEFGVKILIAGMSLGEDNIADVTYDIQMTKADDKVSEKTVHKDLPIYKGVVSKPNYIYNNRAVPLITFEAGDPLGLYTFDVLVKDNIGNSNVALTRQIELVSCASDI